MSFDFFKIVMDKNSTGQTNRQTDKQTDIQTDRQHKHIYDIHIVYIYLIIFNTYFTQLLVKQGIQNEGGGQD